MSQPTVDSLIISRTFNAPRELVFDAWNSKHLNNWWGPKGFTMTCKRLDFVPGGMYHYCMTTPDGTLIWARFIFVAINRPNSLEFINSFSNEAGEIGVNPWMPNWPAEIHNLVTFEESNGKTTLTITGRPINATEEQLALYAGMTQSMQGGFKGTFDQLEAYLDEIQQPATV